MPTRIVLKKNHGRLSIHDAAAAAKKLRRPPQPLSSSGTTPLRGYLSSSQQTNKYEEDDQQSPSARDPYSTPPPIKRRANPINTPGGGGGGASQAVPPTPASGLRSIARRHSTLLSLGVSLRSNLEAEESSDTEDVHNNLSTSRRLSTDDIRASPRLLFYLFTMLSSAVTLVSAAKFYVNGYRPLLDSEWNTSQDRVYFAEEGLTPVYRWKLWACIYMAPAICLLNLFTFLAHFDTLLLPSVWQRVFRDGSQVERLWIASLALLAAVALHASTSSLSPGEYQANVFFTSWISFGTAAGNLFVWRDSAGLPSYLELLQSRNAPDNRETTGNWMWTAATSAVFAGSITSMFLNRANIDLRLKGEELNISDYDWTIILSIVWSEFFLCVIAIALNELVPRSSHIPCICQPGKIRCVLGWRQFEGLLILAGLGGKLYVILRHTGVDGIVNGLNNAYFGVWASFFNSVFTLGTWLNEKSTIDFIERCDDDEEFDGNSW